MTTPTDQEVARQIVERLRAKDRERFEAARAAGRQASLYTEAEVVHVNVRLIGGDVTPEIRYARRQHKDLIGQCVLRADDPHLDRHRIRWAGMGTVEA